MSNWYVDDPKHGSLVVDDTFFVDYDYNDDDYVDNYENKDEDSGGDDDGDNDDGDSDDDQSNLSSTLFVGSGDLMC